MHLVLVGTSYQRAPVELRELLAYDRELRRGALDRLSADGSESAVLSTCNRTEAYLAAPDAAAAEERVHAELASLSGLSGTELAPALYTLTDGAAALHLFRVAAGLDSMVPGEAQILGQVREAYGAARETGAAGPVLHRLFRQALRVGKRVRTETAIGENPASVSAAAAELAERVFEDLAGRRILLLGAGKTSDLTAANLISRGAGEIVVANRSVERAEALARRFNGRGIGLERVEEELERVDVVVASTSAQGHLISAEQVARAMRARRGRPVFFIDIAVPRDVDPAVNQLDGCYLYDIDDLERVVAESVAGRREEAVRAEAIASVEADDFRAWQLSLDVVPAIASLRERAEAIRRAELERAAGRLGSLSPGQRRAVESLTAQIVNKLLHQPTVRMKEAAAAADGVLYADAVRHLFALEDPRAPDAPSNRQPRQ
ncbi:MAG TPA: glutamyl-tRNA reductase [Gaiellaceae bacterium]|nr:glutamyl-tRNA reductase [Gaiellaceae bacterium]